MKVHEVKTSNNAERTLVDMLAVAEGDKLTTITNPYSKQTEELCPTAVALYDLAVGSEVVGDGEMLHKALNIFRRNWPSEFMTLLD